MKSNEVLMKFLFSLILIITSILTIPAVSSARSGSPPNGYAGNPPNNRTCISCHGGFGLNSGQGSLDLSDLPETYEPEGEYEFSLTLADPNAARWGFEFTAINSENDRAGTFTVIDRNNTQLSRPGGDNPEYMKQTRAGTRQGQRQASTWDLQWTAPAEDVGEVRFFFTGNAANNNGRTSGDRIYASSFGFEAAAGETELTVEMENGWNMISINVNVGGDFYIDDEDEGPDVVLMTEQLRIDDDTHNLILMKDGEGRFYNPEFGFTNIMYWDVASGYQIKLREDADAVWSGELVPADEVIPMLDGWNLIAYYPTYELSAASEDFYVLSPIIDQVITAKDGDGNFMIPEFDFSNMPPWRQSQGYLIKLDGDAEFSYPDEAEEQAQSPSQLVNLSPNISPVNTGENMSVLVENIPENIYSTDRQVIAYNLNGDVVGAGVISAGRSGLAVWGDDPTTEQVDGLVENEKFELSYRNIANGIEVKLEYFTFLSGDGLAYKKDSFLAIKARDNADVEIEYSLGEVYPNPFNSSARISYTLSRSGTISIQVFDINGHLVSSLFKGYKQTGVYNAYLTGTNMSSGIYFVRMKTSNKMLTRKLFFMK